MAAGPSAVPPHPPGRTVVRAALAEITSIAPSSMTRTDHEDVTTQLYRLQNELEAVKLHQLRSLTAAAPSRATVIDFLATTPRNLNRTHAARDVELGKPTETATDWDGRIGGLTGDRGALRLTEAKLATGDGSRDTIVELDDGSTVHRSDVKAHILDAIFATTIGRYAPGTTDQLVTDVLAMLHHDRTEKLGHEETDPDGAARRSLTIERHHGPATCDDDSRTNGSTTLHSDPRSLEQRRFDGFTTLITRGADAGDAGDATVRDTATLLVHVHVPVDRLTAQPGTAPDADRATLDGGHPLAITSTQRTATGQQRALLAMRDRGCIAPGCNAPAWLCQAHHVRFWSEGGPTDTTNLVLVCPDHHRQIHQRLLEIRFADDGKPEARWTRPLGPWTRNHYPRHLERVKIAAKLLTADTDVGPEPPEPPPRPCVILDPWSSTTNPCRASRHHVPAR